MFVGSYDGFGCKDGGGCCEVGGYACGCRRVGVVGWWLWRKWMTRFDQSVVLVELTKRICYKYTYIN
ncbi:hypothetical protein HanRHA438_Chr04g0166641 [Helianthus annuus]|nr:hypothetical protein HanRHA438_Chr04g0166641 [Helianthus annuus]